MAGTAHAEAGKRDRSGRAPGLALACLPGGLLWALSPLGVSLSERAFSSPDVFWQLFPSAPLLLLVGLTGLYLRGAGHHGLLGKAGLLAALAGLVMVVAGIVGQFFLDLDSEYIMMAPANSTFRVGLMVLGAGSAVFAAAAARSGVLPLWGALPLLLASLGGLVAFYRELGAPGAALWTLFGAAWAWVGLILLVEVVRGLLSWWRGRRAGGRKQERPSGG
ncbi:MAG: hypothetical protein H0V53_05780 [Rubrobacter sp.]|nr:hypothetical protein [Rubrobacter sp.]